MQWDVKLILGNQGKCAIVIVMRVFVSGFAANYAYVNTSQRHDSEKTKHLNIKFGLLLIISVNVFKI